MATCPECGAALSAGTSCEEIFNEFLALELTDPEYGEVHLLTVACYMVQHRRYSDEALAWVAQRVRANLEGAPIDRIRRQAARETDQSRRSWRVIRRPDARPLALIAWSLTIADVAARYQDAASYRALVREWAAATLREMQAWL